MPNQSMLEEEKIKKQKEEETKKSKDADAKKEEVAKAFGISLADIEHVELNNGKEFFKFYNPKDRTVKMIENRDYGNGLSKQFKSIQQELSFTQSDNERDNAARIYEHSSAHKNIELSLIPIEELRSNRFKYMRAINELSTIDRKKVMALIKSSKEVRLTHINIENAIGIDEDHNVIDVVFDYANNRAIIRNARVLNYQDQNEYTDNDEELVEISGADFDKLVENITISDDTPVVTNPEERMTVRGEEISVKTAVQLYEMPEAIDKMDLSPKKRRIYMGIVEALKRRIAAKTNEKKTQKQKVLVNENDHKAA